MASLSFPFSPVNGQLYPTSPLAGENQYQWSSPTQTWIFLGTASGAIAGTYGDSDNVGQFTVDTQGKITFAQNVPIASGAGGTVTSVGVSGGTTGLTTSGGPVTAAGTITLGGTLALTNGGTGATTQSGAQANLLPAQATHANQFLKTDGAGVLSWDAAGTVSSVDVSGSTTGLTFSGGPVTSSGTITMAGTLALTNGGTGATDQAGAQANLLPTQAGNSGKVLSTDGAGVISWITPNSGTVTSVDVSGGTTGLTTSGGPVTGSGTVTLGGTLNITNGGTGASTVSGAQANLLPAQAGNAGKILSTDGAGVLSWAAYTATAPVVVTGTIISIDLGLGLAANGTNLAFKMPVASTPPAIGTGAAQAFDGSMYWDDTLGQLFVRYNNSGTPFWVAAAPPAGGSSFPAGTRMTFQQSAAPTGWVKDTTYNNYAMRIVNGAVGTGGTVGFTTAFASGLSSTGHSLTISEMPTHNHAVNDPGHQHNLPFPAIINNFSMSPEGGSTPIITGDSGITSVDSAVTGITIQNNGAGTAHSHGLPSFDVQYVDFIIATKS